MIRSSRESEVVAMEAVIIPRISGGESGQDRGTFVKCCGEEMAHSIWSESLGSFSDAVAATRPAPAGVAAAAMTAELGLSLMIKAMSITGGHDELVAAAR